MKILAFDTCMQACSVAVLNNGELFSHKVELERGHAEKLMPMIDEVLQKADLSIREIDRIAVTRGPGSFTGVRIGVATAKALALALGAELVGTSSLHVMAAQAFASVPELQTDLICVTVDARRDQIYFALFDRDGPLAPRPLIIAPAQAGAFLPADKSLCLIGSGCEIMLNSLTKKQSARVSHSGAAPFEKILQPDAGTLAKLAPSLLIDKKPLTPLYLRPADAKIQVGYAIERQKSRTST